MLFTRFSFQMIGLILAYVLWKNPAFSGLLTHLAHSRVSENVQLAAALALGRAFSCFCRRCKIVQIYATCSAWGEWRVRRVTGERVQTDSEGTWHGVKRDACLTGGVGDPVALEGSWVAVVGTGHSRGPGSA